jgi:hypothetical protein
MVSTLAILVITGTYMNVSHLQAHVSLLLSNVSKHASTEYGLAEARTRSQKGVHPSLLFRTQVWPRFELCKLLHVNELRCRLAKNLPVQNRTLLSTTEISPLGQSRVELLPGRRTEAGWTASLAALLASTIWRGLSNIFALHINQCTRILPHTHIAI